VRLRGASFFGGVFFAPRDDFFEVVAVAVSEDSAGVETVVASVASAGFTSFAGSVDFVDVDGFEVLATCVDFEDFVDFVFLALFAVFDFVLFAVGFFAAVVFFVVLAPNETDPSPARSIASIKNRATVILILQSSISNCVSSLHT
jgi:membrane glycosyltransferase